mgnify:CR=1 FL=1
MVVINFCGAKWQGGAPESVANDGLAGWWRHFPYPIIFICPPWGKPSSDGALSPSPPDIISIHRGKQGKTADIRQGKAPLPRPPSRSFEWVSWWERWAFIHRCPEISTQRLTPRQGAPVRGVGAGRGGRVCWRGGNLSRARRHERERLYRRLSGRSTTRQAGSLQVGEGGCLCLPGH